MIETGIYKGNDHLKANHGILANDGALANQVISDRTSVTHGIHRTKTITSSQIVKSVTHNFHSGQYLVLYEDGSLDAFLKYGRLKNGNLWKLQKLGKFDGIVYASKSQMYIAWTKEGNIKLLTDSFDEVSEVMSQSPINAVIYNEFKNEIISTTVGKILVWKFSLNNSLLVPLLMIKDSLDPNNPNNVIAIEQTSSKLQRLFVAVNNGIIVFRLKDGQCIYRMPDLHKRSITDILFYQPFQVLLTSALDGSIKMWDKSCNLRSVFVGHTDVVTCLSVCQSGPLALSGSADGSIRLWNIDANEQVECIETGEAVTGICRKLGESDFYTYSSNSLSFWKINNLYSIFTIIGSTAKVLKTTINPTVMCMSYYICEDACVRFVCPSSGNIVCVMMSPEWKRIKDAIFIPSKRKVFVLLRDGTILKCSTEKNPCKIEDTWTTKHSGAKSNCTTLCVFENILEEKLMEYKRKDLVTQKKFKKEDKKDIPSDRNQRKGQERLLLVGGCEDGKLVVYNWSEGTDCGKIYYSVQAHRDRIVALANSNVLNQIASCSTDNTVRIWYVHPFMADTITPLMFILNNEPATHLIYGRNRLCIALQEPSTATYNVTMFKTTDSEPERIEHGTDDDHQDAIIALCFCSRLNIFASASADGTIKIWNENNGVVRIIKLHSKPSGMCFCAEKGDLLVGIGVHVYKISHEKYLPTKMLQHMVVMHFNVPQNIAAIPVDEDVMAALNIDQRHRLNKARSSETLLAKFVDTIPLEELEERKLQDAEKELAFSIFTKRDNDLEQIRKGELTAKKKPIDSKPVREEAWRKYLDLFYKRKPIPAIGLNEDDDDADDDDETAYRPKETGGTFVPEPSNARFFSVSADVSDIKRLTAQLREGEDDKEKNLNDKTGSERSLSFHSLSEFPFQETTRPLSAELWPEFTHNSSYVLLRRILSAPAKFRVPEFVTNLRSNTKLLKPIDVPPASDFPQNLETIRNINRKITAEVDTQAESFNKNRKSRGLLPIAPDGYLPNSIIVALYKELKKEEPAEEKEEEDWKPKGLSLEQLEELKEHERKKSRKSITMVRPLADLEQKHPSINERPQSIIERFDLSQASSRMEGEIDIETPPPTPPQSPPPTEKAPEPPAKPKVLKPLKPIKKLISKPVVSVTPTPPPRDPTPCPPRPETPLPMFIAQFVGQGWFETFFPNAKPKMFPKPWTVENFLLILLDLLEKSQNYNTRTSILTAILILYRQRPFTKEAVINAQNFLIAMLMTPFEESPDEAEAKSRCIKLALTLLTTFGLFDRYFIVELMTQYIVSNIDIRQHIIQILHQDIGIEDPHNYFLRELDKFTTYGIFDHFKKKESVNQQCSDWLDKWIQLVREHIMLLRGKIYRAKKGNVVRGTKSGKTNVKGILKKGKEEASPVSSERKISFMPNEFISDAARNIGPVDAINYFCEVEYEKEIERAREASVAPTEETVKTERLRNSVVLLPKIEGYRSLARLGETHKSCCHPERETVLAYDLRLPNINQSNKDNFRNGLLLHLQPLTLNPFPNFLDELLYEPYANSQLITLRSAPKYFVPARSYVSDV